MNSTELRDLLEAYSEVYTPQEVDEAMTAVASPAPGGRGKKNPYTKEVRTSAGSKTSPRYSNVEDADRRMKTPLSRYDMPKMELKRGVNEAQYTAPPQIQQPPAEVRKAPTNKLDPGATVGTGIAAAYVGNEIGKKLLKKKPGVKGVFEEFDTFNYLLEYLIAEGYADTNKAAIAIMANMSEEWRQSIVEEVLDEELTGSRAERARELMAAARPHGRRRAATDATYNALNRILKAKEGSIPPGRQPEHNIRGDEKLPTRRGGSGIRGRAKTYTDAGPTQSGRGNRATRRGGGTVDDTRYDESFDLFGTILEYLVAEGYAATNKEALAIMSNMSEEWRESIIESQYARENPEKYEREQAKAKSKKQKAMEDPHTGINSPAFEKFMRQQMGR